MTHTYNNARLRSGLSLLQPTGTWTNGFLYDAAHRLTNITSQAGTFSYGYKVGQASSLPIKLALPNSSYVTNTYDNVARLSGTYLDNSSNTILDKSEYLYNTNNQRIRLTRTDGSYYTNTYDNIGQLKWADSTVASEDRGYVYDAAWNLNYRTNNTTVSTFTVDSKNQLVNTPDGSCGYDNNGNLTSSHGGYWTYTYDAENQLVTWQNYNTAKTDYVYDGRGRLRKRLDYTWLGSPYNQWSSPTETRYIYDGMRVIQERNSGNTPTVAYTRGNDMSGSLEGAGGIGGLLARSHGYSSGSWTGHNFYHADGNGNVTMLIDNAGTPNVTATYRYDPYGNSITATGTNAANNVYRFSSKEYHVNSGMYYYGYRFYDPNLQRWLNRDPIFERGGINLYAFVFNDPLWFVDLFGLSPADVEKIKKCFKDQLDFMNRTQGRKNNPHWNNFCHWFSGAPGCWDQEIYTTDFLSRQKYDDVWSFMPQSGLAHHWGLAASLNPYDPSIIYDPWLGEITITPPPTVFPIRRNAPPPFPSR